MGGQMFGHNGDDQGQPQTDDAAAPPADTSQSWQQNDNPPQDATAHPADQPHDLEQHEADAPVVETVHPDFQQPAAVAPVTPDHLLDIKQKALGQLSPLVGHLDQSPEEKFRILMMMIQASDDQSLLQEAYDTAEKITDEKAKAQALLDVVNEINYFTQHKN